MTITTYPTRLLGGRNVGVKYDDSVGTLSIMNQSISLSSLSAALQAQWAAAVASVPLGSRGAVPAIGGDNIGQMIGQILDSTPTWRAAVQAAVSNYAASVANYGDPETWMR
jgi:hypothetical protein